ncbi:MAG: hypothetical protein HY466_07160 [Deltaproteobacteria bacterium]|nr:hypothetical protein [Deltaproteobacteria bacterium]
MSRLDPLSLNMTFLSITFYSHVVYAHNPESALMTFSFIGIASVGSMLICMLWVLPKIFRIDLELGGKIIVGILLVVIFYIIYGFFLGEILYEQLGG